MANRLRNNLRAIPYLCGICLCLLSARDLVAQSNYFNVPPLTVTTLAVGSNCTVSLQGNITPPVVTSTIGATIVVSMFDQAGSGYALSDFHPLGAGVPVVWYVEDNMGHSYSFNYLLVQIVDNTPPAFNLISVPTPITYNSIVEVPTLGPLPATDNCTASNNLVQTFSETARPDTCDPGTFTRTWRVTDQSGNTATYTQTINITVDNLPPVILAPFPANGSSPCEALPGGFQTWLATQMANFNATDASGIKSLTNNAPANYPGACPVPVNVTFVATDNCLLVAFRTVTFSTSDVQPPQVTTAPKDTVAYCTPSGSPLTRLGQWIQSRGYSQISDACTAITYRTEINNVQVDSAQIVAALLASYANGCNSQTIGSQMFDKVRGKVTVKWVARDACGNETTAGTATFGVIDTLPPIITGVNVTEECGTNPQDNTALQNWINAHGNTTITDECSQTTWSNFTFVTSTGQSGTGLFNSGPYPQVQAHNCNWWTDVTFRAFDDCGNLGQKTLRFQIQDNTDPVIAGFPDSIVLACPNPVPVLPLQYVSDNCDTSLVITKTIVQSDSLCDGSYTMTVTWSATDDCNNTGTAVQTVLVRDTIAPVFTLVPANKTFRCDTFALPPVPVMGVNINATDNCSPVTSITTQTISAQNPDPQQCGYYQYQITRIFTATDECGNTRTATQVISVVDNQGPVFAGFTDTTGVCDVAPVLPIPVATDACSGITATPDTVSVVNTSNGCLDAYTLTITWIAADVCGNTNTFSQNIAISDTVRPTLVNIPPDVTVSCDAIPVAPNTSTFNADDNCDANVDVTLLETQLRDPDLNSCDHWTNYIIRREWTATDNCGNTRRYTQNILIQDNTPPQLIPPAALSLPNDPGDCGRMVTIPPPLSVTDVCTSLPMSVTLLDTSMLVKTAPGLLGSTPVDTVVFQWNTPNISPAAPVTAPAALRIYLDNADADAATETFTILGENNTPLGVTTLVTPGQCGSGFTDITIPANLLNNWLSDGVLRLRLAPNSSGGGAVNAVCPGGSFARAQLQYNYTEPQVPVDLEFSLDAMPAQPYPPATPFFLAPGIHTIVYTATDCAGNATSASVTVTISDQEPPVITPPPTQNFYVQPNECETIVTLPFPDISDNCDVSGSLTQASPILPLQFANDPNAGLIPNMITLNISGLVPNAVSGGVLKIRHKGDNDQSGEFFEVFDESNTSLGFTTNGPATGVCTDFYETLIPISAAQINAWAANGSTSIKLVANNEAGTFFEFIGPCAALLPDQTDGISRVQAVLEYSFAVITYEVRNSANQLVQTGGINGTETNLILSPDHYSVQYLTSDVHGLEGNATFQLNVLDTIRPTAVCQATTIYVNPSGAPGTNYTLLPSEIDNGSTDNCPGNLQLQVLPNVFSCAQAGSNFNVSLTVTDSSGNTNSCNTIVRVENVLPMPSYLPVCEGGTLELFANPPSGPPNAFTYMWSGPLFSSALQNPVRTNAQASFNGVYSVKITGLTGCMSTGTVNVQLTTLPNQPTLSVANQPLCSGDDIVLSTPTFGGGNPTYQWYQGIPGNSFLLATTTAPTITLPESDAGTYQFYVKVSASGCTSLNSEVLIVMVAVRPTAIPDQEVINVCQGQPIIFGTSSMGMGMTYNWTGPGGFMSNQQYPPPILSAMPFHAGIYTLTVSQSGCTSKPANVQVIVRPKPAKPFLSGSNQVCEGANITLLASTPTAAQYIWQSPNQSTVNTTVNSLLLPSVMVADSGMWRVRVVQQGCLSDWSDSLFIRIQAYPDVTAGSNSPICAGGSLNLGATANVGNLNWCWTGPDNFINYQQFTTRMPAVAGVYKIVGKTSFGCADSAFVNVSVISLPVIDSIIQVAPMCSDGTTDAVLTPLVTAQNGPLTFVWAGPPNGSVISNDSILVIPDVSTVNNGPYILTVRNAFGCSSAPKTTTVNVGPPLVVPTLSQPAPICEGGNIVLSITNAGQYNPSAKFTWTRPSGDTMTTHSFLNFPNAQVAQSGMYSVYVNDGICQSGASAPVAIIVNAIPAAPVLTANTPVCEGGVLQLNANVVAGATYTWAGPEDFSSSNSNPARQPVTLSFAGTYSTTITVNNCVSPPSSIEVEVTPRPKKPTIIPLASNNICIEQPGTTLTLTLTNVTPGSQYFWLNETGDTIAGPLNSVSVTFNNLNTVFSPGVHTFRAFAWRNGCDSEISNALTIHFDTIPDNTAYAGPDGPVCTAQTIMLAATPPASGTGLWSQLGTPAVTINSPGSPSSSVTGMNPGNVYQFIWSLSSGGCMNYSRDTVTLAAQALELPNAGEDQFYCTKTGIQLNATQGQMVSGVWSQPASQAGLGIQIDSTSKPNTTISGAGLTPGNTYFFYWSMGNAGCGTQVDEVAIHIFSQKPNAGPDQFLCNNQDCTLLDASNLAAFEYGVWTNVTPGITFTTPSSDQTTICGLQPGPNILVWTINNGICSANSRDTVVVNFELFPTANTDAVEVLFGTAATFNVLSNDVVPSQFSVEITVDPVHGRIVENPGIGTYVYQPNSNFSGIDQLEYEICNLRCPEACSYTTVVFNTTGPGDCFLPNIITPNQDNLNDAFIIPETCLAGGEGKVDVEVTIFNQWGDQVFHALPYTNDWEGTYNGNPLPAGTYFYVVQFSDPLFEPKKGFLILQR